METPERKPRKNKRRRRPKCLKVHSRKQLSAFLVSVLRYGGDNEIRTHDPLLARQVLSQLSYTPTLLSFAIYGQRKLNSV
jgi:hypothetical protein